MQPLISHFQPHNKIFFSLLKKFVQCAIIVISINRLHTQKKRGYIKMRKFISRVAALLLAGVMTAAVAGCGKTPTARQKTQQRSGQSLTRHR